MTPRELSALLVAPPGLDALPPFMDGWRRDGRSDPYLSYVDEPEVNWSEQLEAMHEESTRDHFIDRWTRRAVLDALSVETEPFRVVADIGCSTGYLLEDIRVQYPTTQLVGVDLVAAGLRKAHAGVPSAALLLADVTRLPLCDATIDAVASINVLEHVPDDSAALREIARVLRPGGLAAVVVPADPGLFDYYDQMLGHVRRYAPRELATKSRAAGLQILLDTHLGWTLYPAFYARKKFNRRRHRSPAPAELERLVARDIASTQDSAVGRVATGMERAMLGRGFRARRGIRNLVLMRRSR